MRQAVALAFPRAQRARFIALILVTTAVLAAAGVARAAHVAPVLVAGNPSCAGMVTVQPVVSGTIPASFAGQAGSITLNVRQTAAGPEFDFSTDRATHVVTVAIVKGGSDANRYDYGAGAAADTGLHAPLNTSNGTWYGLSHLCFATGVAPAAPPPTPTPPAPTPPAPTPPAPTPPGPTPPPPSDVCPNITGVQTTVPAGMAQDAAGNCVAAPSPAPLVDLAVRKVDTPDPVSVGGNVRYAILVTNRGGGAATGVTMTDTLPGGVVVVSTSTTQGACSAAGARITCRLGSLAVGASATVTVVARATAAGQVRNVARVVGSQPDPNTANNASSVTTRVVAPFQPPAARCDSVTVGRRSIAVGVRTTLRVVVKAKGRALSGMRVRVRGAGIDASARTNRAGVALVTVRAQRAGIVTITVAEEPCRRRIGAITGSQPNLTG